MDFLGSSDLFPSDISSIQFMWVSFLAQNRVLRKLLRPEAVSNTLFRNKSKSDQVRCQKAVPLGVLEAANLLHTGKGGVEIDGGNQSSYSNRFSLELLMKLRTVLEIGVSWGESCCLKIGMGSRKTDGHEATELIISCHKANRASILQCQDHMSGFPNCSYAPPCFPHPSWLSYPPTVLSPPSNAPLLSVAQMKFHLIFKSLQTESADTHDQITLPASKIHYPHVYMKRTD